MFGFLKYFLTGTASAETVAETAKAADNAVKLSFDPMNFVDNLQYMGIGMLTIFIVIGVIILATLAINKIFSKK